MAKLLVQFSFIIFACYQTSSAEHISLEPYENFTSLFEKAEGGDLEAQVRLGIDYFNHGAINDARYWLTVPAKNGHVEAQYQLGLTFLGWNISTENEQAIHWLTRAAENGHKSAIYTIIHRYSFGIQGFPKDKEKAKYWSKIARVRKDET